MDHFPYLLIGITGLHRKTVSKPPATGQQDGSAAKAVTASPDSPSLVMTEGES